MNNNNLKAGWQSKPIGALCELVNGRAFKPSDWSRSGLPIVRIQNLTDPEKPYNYYDGVVKKKHLIKNGDILLSWSGTPGTSFGCFLWERGRAILNQHIFRVDVNERLCNKEYFMFGVNNVLDEMIAQAHGGVGLRHITKGKLEAIRLPIAPMAEQRRIVDRLKECFKRTDQIERLSNEAIRESKRIVTALLNEIDSEIRVTREPLGSAVLSLRNGFSLRARETRQNGYALTLSSVRSLDLDLTQCKPTQLDAARLSTYGVSQGDVFVSRSNTFGLVGLSSIVTQKPDKKVIYPDLLIKLTPNPERVLPRYLTIILRTPSVRRQIQSSSRGTSQSMVKISGASLRDVRIPLPAIDEQTRIIRKVDSVRKASDSISACIESMLSNSLRQSILQRAFAGEL